MASFTLTVQAAQELKEIYRYSYHTFGEAQAERYVQQIARAFPLLAERPGLGRAIRRLTDYFRFNVGRHAIIYRPTLEGTTVVHIFHQPRDIEDLMADDES